MLKNSIIIILLFFLLSCKTNKDQKNIDQSLVDNASTTLPFFNNPDWTPEWISSNSAQYNRIHRIPSFSFIDQDGTKVTEKTVAGKIYIANFFFTTCRGICPKMTSNMYLLQSYFFNDTSVMMLSHSVTPEKDDTSVLKKYAIENKVNSKKWRLLTGDKKEIYNLAKQQYFAGDSVGFYQTGNEFLHTENFILIDKHARIRGVYNGTLLVEIERIKEDIATLQKED